MLHEVVKIPSHAKEESWECPSVLRRSTFDLCESGGHRQYSIKISLWRYSSCVTDDCFWDYVSCSKKNAAFLTETPNCCQVRYKGCCKYLNIEHDGHNEFPDPLPPTFTTEKPYKHADTLSNLLAFTYQTLAHWFFAFHKSMTFSRDETFILTIRMREQWKLLMTSIELNLGDKLVHSTQLKPLNGSAWPDW